MSPIPKALSLLLQVPWLHAVYAVLGAGVFTLVSVPLGICLPVPPHTHTQSALPPTFFLPPP